MLKIDFNITYFAFFPRNCRVSGVHEERKAEEGKGEGGRGEEEREGEHVFLTFRMVTGRASAVSDRRSAWEVTCAFHGQISFTTSRQKDSFFSWKKTLFTQVGPFCKQGPNYVKKLFLISYTSLFPRKKNDRVLIT